MICSTLSGKVAVKHPKLCVLVRDDGAVFNKAKGKTRRWAWTYGKPNSNGYCHVMINRKKIKVHRLVADVFIPNPEHKPFVDHINRIRSDNRAQNLRWATRKENSENSATVYNRKCKTRACDDRTGYAREYRAAKKQQKAAQ